MPVLLYGMYSLGVCVSFVAEVEQKVEIVERIEKARVVQSNK